MTNPAHHNYLELTPDQIFQSELMPSTSWWHRKSIRFKTTILAIALGTIPTLVVGATAYHFAANSIRQETTEVKKTQVTELQNQLSLFMGDRYKDIQMMAKLPIFSDPELRSNSSQAEKAAVLQNIHDIYGFYNSIAVFDARGELVAQNKGKALGNHLNRSYIQAALKADRAVISQPQISTSSGIYSVYTASPIKDAVSGATIGFVRARIPVATLQKVIEHHSTPGNQYYLLNAEGEIFLGSEGEYVVRTQSDGSSINSNNYDYEAINASEIFADSAAIITSSDLATGAVFNQRNNKPQFLTYAPAQYLSELPDLNWQAIIATDQALIRGTQRKLRWVFVLGSGLIAFGVGAIAYHLANRALRPILTAAAVVQEIGGGDFASRVPVQGADELAQLGYDINRMATQLANQVQTQTLLAQHSESIKDLAIQLARISDSSEILELAVKKSHQTLNADHLVYFQFTDGYRGQTVAECRNGKQLSLLDSSLPREIVSAYQNRFQQQQLDSIIINNVEQTTEPLAQYLTSWGVKSCMMAPVATEDELHGLLMIYQSSTPLPWLEAEIEYVNQVTNQVSFALTRLQFLEQQQAAEIREKQARESIQSRALELLEEVDDVSAGNLTIRANVTDDEIGTIADSYNATIESLQKLVNQTKVVAMEVQQNTSSSDKAIQSLAQQTSNQTSAIKFMLDQMEQMSSSIDSVAQQASQAENFVQQAAQTINQGDQTMNLTVTEINAVQQTVTETAAKAEKLGESSQEISQAVNLISRFAAQTHHLALKASIEAARAGEQGKGFAVIADEVRSLATQSAEATAEIETLVNKIQLETGEVVSAMNQGANQIAEGSSLIQQTRDSLTRVNEASHQIRQLISSIATAAQQQSVTTAEVGQSMAGISTIAEHNSRSATQVSASFRQLAATASKLQSGIDKFKT